MSQRGELQPGKAEFGVPPGNSRTDELATDFVDRWQRGERVPAEAYLHRHPNLDADSAFELVLTEVVLRQEFGQAAPLEEFLWRFPQFADRLRRHFAMHASLEPRISSGCTVLQLQPTRRMESAQVPPSLPGFELLGELGRGGMAVVYRAREISLGREVALKFLPAEYAEDPERLDRFMHEARTASALNHPNICTVHALGDHEARPFIVMEMVEGQTLQAIATQRPAIAETARHMRQAACALAAAHAAGVVHRDIKPENIMVRPDGFVKVLDFGLARRLPVLMPGGIDEHRTTCPGVILGTVAYMSPEQARGEPAETASDIFSLGIILYQLVTGEHPFDADSVWEMLHAISSREPIPATQFNPTVPAALGQLTEAMLHKDARLRPTAAEVEASLQALSIVDGNRVTPATADRAIVRRQPETAALRTALDQADAGHGSVLCLAGEPGIGKTTLVEDFLASLADDARPYWIGRGRCSERLAETEAYLPVIDALEDLLRCDGSGTVARLMQLVAPTWFSHVRPGAAARTLNPFSLANPMPSAVQAEAGYAPSSVRALSQRAMLREFCNLVQEVSRRGPVVLLFDDVHWADGSTVDLLAYLGRHCRRFRVLVIATYRSTELLLGPHPFHRVKLDLLGSGVCTEHVLGLLQHNEIRDYLDLAFPGHAFPGDLVDLVHQATDGNPLFMVDLLRYLRERGVIADRDGRWRLVKDAPDLRRDVPGSIVSMIERKLDLLSDEDRRLLAAASVRGHEFDSAALAGAMDLDAAHVEERLEQLDRVHGLVRLLRQDEFADGGLTLRYAFVHALYQQSLYGSLQPSRRVALGTAMARTLERDARVRKVVPAELACLYEVGRDFSRAAKNFWLAAQDAASVFAHREAIGLARRGLRLLEYLPETADRFELELSLQTTLAMQLQVTNGFAAREAWQAYDRARQLCRTMPDAARLFPVLWGLWLFSKVRSELPKAQEMADELMALAQQLRDPDLALQAYQALGMTAFCSGRPSNALKHVEQAIALYDRERHRAHAYQFGQDPGVICKAFGAVVLWLIGFPEQAVRQSEAAMQMSRCLSPSSQAVALHFAAMLHQLLRDPVRAGQCATGSSEIAAEHGFSFWQAGSSVLGGWALAAGGSSEQGLRRLRQGLHDWSATDSITYRTYYLGLLADVLIGRGEFAEGKQAVDEALALVEQTGERLYEAELYRLSGELRLPEDKQAAEELFRRAQSVARQQQARSLELRAAISLSLLHSNGKPGRVGRQTLAETLEQFTEGFETHDILRARRILSK